MSCRYPVVHSDRFNPFSRAIYFLATFALVLLPLGDARAVGPDLAARGLDVFLHAPPSGAPGTEVPIDVLAYGFPEVTHPVPLPNADIEASWDPESLPKTSVMPPSVHARTDAEGRAHLSVLVPEGEPWALELLVGVRQGPHARTQSLKIARTGTSTVELHTTDSRVVPGSTISAWVRAIGTSDNRALAATRVHVELDEGGASRFSEDVTTDAAGMAMLRIPIPRVEELVWHWELSAKVVAPGATPASMTLTPREEIPGLPTVHVAFEPPATGVFAGDHVPFVIRLRDATGQALANHEVRYWLGQKGLELPKIGDKDGDKEWLRVSAAAVTDGTGEIHKIADAPTLVKSSGTAIHLAVRTEIEGHEFDLRSDVGVGVPVASATLEPEAHVLVPGISQRLWLRVQDGVGDGVKGEFQISGDGLETKITTNDHGEAEVTWNAPLGVGAFRNVGPCASGVAAAVVVRPTREIAALRGRKEPFALCVQIDREQSTMVFADPLFAHPGDTVKIKVARGSGPAKATGPLSVIATSHDAPQSVSAWIDTNANEGKLTVPPSAAVGTWDLSASIPERDHESRTVQTRLFIVPRVLPQLEVKRTGGRAAPLGKIEVEASLTDGHGKPLVGAVSAIVVDSHGGGVVNVGGLDTRSRLCGELGLVDDCNALLEGDASLDPERRALFSELTSAPTLPSNDPGAHASKDLYKTFETVLHSLEGAVFEAAMSPDKLLDVRRRENGLWKLNPELFTLVTDAMTPPPETPGGEALKLSDLVAVDPQVTFDTVAKRVTRLKLFRVLAAVRTFRREKQLDSYEPVWNDPNALLRRLVRENQLTDDLLLDPWGGTIQFVRSNAPPVPFLSIARGFELRAPGPDGIVNTADDVRDPFERFVKKGSPYALAVQEDRIVDAKWDMDVSDATVEGWKSLLDELTGQTLGSGGLGLSGVGEGGGGYGSGIGLGGVGTIGHGSGRGTSGVATGDAYWSPPMRTDSEGHVKMIIPLGDVETTWRIGFIGATDLAGPASTTMDVPSELPLSTHVDVGARLIEGDAVDAKILVRNRTKQALRTTLTISADGVAVIDPQKGDAPKGAITRVVDVPADGAKPLLVRVRASSAGHAILVVSAHADGAPDDVLRHEWEVLPAGEKRMLTQNAFVEGSREIGIDLADGYRLRDTPVLVLERGFTEPLSAALESLEPDRQVSPTALVDSLDAALRIERWSQTQHTPREIALAAIAHRFATRAAARFDLLSDASNASRGVEARENSLTLKKTDEKKEETCPPSTTDTNVSTDEILNWLEIEPHPAPDVPPCWGAFVAEAGRTITNADATNLARGILILAEKQEHAALTASLLARLREEIALGADGTIKGPTHRSDRAIVYAALLRGVKLGQSPATADVLFAQIGNLRDAEGGYASTTAALAVVRALLSSQLEGHGATRARIRVQADKGIDAFDRAVDVPENGWVSVALSANVLNVAIDAEGPAMFARLERPVLRLWTHPPPIQSSPVGVDIVWPSDAEAGKTGILRIILRHSLASSRMVDTRIPLPPGVTLAAQVAHANAIVSQLQGVLTVRWPVDSYNVVAEIPIRFGLSGHFTIPEAIAKISKDSYGEAIAPARALDVSPPKPKPIAVAKK